MQQAIKQVIKVGFIEDDKVLQGNFKQYCEQSQRLECVIAVDSAEKFIKYANTKVPLDIVIVDIGLPGISGIQAIKFIKRLYPDAEIIMLTIYNDHDNVFQTLRHGASGYLLKNLSLKKLEAHLVSIVDIGEVILSPQIARRIIQFFQAEKTSVQIEKSDIVLTPVETQIIKLITQGVSYEKIADLLNISIHGVRFHIKNIYKKLRIKSKSELLNLYIKGFFKKHFL